MPATWQDQVPRERYVVPDDIQDLSFQMRAKCLPLDHAHALSCALIDALPWLEDEPRAGIHLIHVAESGNGWFRPEDPDTELLHVSRRTRLRLRLPKDRLNDARRITGRTLSLGGYDIRVGESAIKPLAALTTLYARYVMGHKTDDENDFIDAKLAELDELGVRVRKLLCGRRHRFIVPDGFVYARSLLLADLELEESILLQQQGLGGGRKLGCGLFLPHKGVRPVNSELNQ